MILLVFLAICGSFYLPGIDCQGVSGNAYVLGPQPTYFILTPRKVRPGEVLQVSATCLRLLYSSLHVRVSIRHEESQDSEREYAFAEEMFMRPATRLMQLPMPENIPFGKYFIYVQGSVTQKGGLIFTNRTEIEFERKQLSIFIQTSKDVYHQNQIVRFRVIPVKPNLMPFSGTLTRIEVVDATNTTVRRWLSPITNAGGIIERDFPLAPQISEGVWNIRTIHNTYVYNKPFRVIEYWQPRFDVNVSMPPRLTEFDFGVYGIIIANRTSGRPVKGNATIQLDLRAAGTKLTDKPMLTVTRNINIFSGRSDFLFTMVELKQMLSSSGRTSVVNTEVFTTVSIYDWFLQQTVSSKAYTYIYSSKPIFKFLGRGSRPFRPGMPMEIMAVVYNPDGTRLITQSGIELTLDIKCEDTRIVQTFRNIPVPDTGIVHKFYTPDIMANCRFYLVEALLKRASGQPTYRKQYFFRHHSESNSYLRVSMSTKYPRVDEYAVFHVQTNYYSPEIYYQVAAAGNIVHADKISLPSNVLSKTFSFALSRDMVPIARVVAFYVRQDGEVVSDALTFFANLTTINDIDVQFNRGKDLNVDTIEVNGFAKPGSYMSFSAVHYDLFVHGGVQILRDFELIDELKSYENHAQQPFEHTWHHTEEHIQRSYIPSPSLGPDANMTMNYSGLILFTDSNYTKVSFAHDCNETLDQSRAFPCYFRPPGSPIAGTQCYSRLQRCNGNIDCNNGVDEMDCPERRDPEDPIPRNKSDVFSYLSRHFDDGAWLWKSFFVKPDGRIDFRVDLPKIDTSWVVGAFANDRVNGLSIQQQPFIMSGFRRFFITVEMPEVAYWGEQIGVRVAVFNYWNYWTETLVELKKSQDYEVVKVGWRGSVSSYSPETWLDKDVHSLVYLEAGESKYIHFPIIPTTPLGNATITICAFSYIGGNCETRTVYIKMNGVTNFYHTPYLLDMTGASSLKVQNFWIEVPQEFVEPEKRELRYIPGSQKADVSVVGDIMGPGLSASNKFATCESTLNIPAGAAENIFYELGYNMQLLQYQYETKQLTNKVRNNNLDYCNILLQRLMSYYNNTEGGFQNFRENDLPSVWLSTYGLFVLLESSFPEWDKLIYIPLEIISHVVDFLDKRQDRNVTSSKLYGSFFEDGPMWDSKYFPDYKPKDGSTPTPEEKEIMKRVPLTALAVIALKHKRMPLSNSKAKVVSDAALMFLKNNLIQITDVFSLSITAYALTSEADQYATKAMAMMSEMRRSQKYQYWANGMIPDMRSEPSTGSVWRMLPKYEWPNNAYATQATAFGLFAMNKNKELRFNRSSTIYWLNSQRNWNSGFTSTQDTLFTMKALKEEAVHDLNRDIYAIDVNLSPSSLSNFQRTVKMRHDNFSHATQVGIPTKSVWGEIMMNAEGSGNTLLQLAVQVNVNSALKLKKPKDPGLCPESSGCVPVDIDPFALSCKPNFRGHNNSIMEMQACTKWQYMTKSPKSGMAVLELSIPTGFIVMNDALRHYRNSGLVPNLRRAIFDYQLSKVSFFFDYVDNVKETCVTFRADRWYPVANMTQDHMCRVYEYYETGLYKNSLYQATTLFNNHICSVCGSFQCPYCPDFNSAPSGPTITLLTLLSPIFVLFLLRALPRTLQHWLCRI